MQKEHKDKITKALNECEVMTDQFFKCLEENFSVKEASAIKYLYLENSFFAGAYFRKVFLDEKPKNAFVLFRNADAAVEFQDRFFRNNKVIPTSHIDTAEHKFKFNNMIFWLKQTGEPSTIINNFDFTFNQHYFSLASFEMKFNADTFDKRGRVVNTESLYGSNLIKYAKALTYMNEGFLIEKSSMFNLLTTIINERLPKEEGLGNIQSVMPVSDQINHIKKLEIKLSNIWYTENEYILNKTAKSKSEQVYFDIEMPRPPLNIPNTYAWQTIPSTLGIPIPRRTR